MKKTNGDRLGLVLLTAGDASDERKANIKRVWFFITVAVLFVLADQLGHVKNGSNSNSGLASAELISLTLSPREGLGDRVGLSVRSLRRHTRRRFCNALGLNTSRPFAQNRRINSTRMRVAYRESVRLEGYELILGSNVDPVFGPVILFGSGGQLVEVYRDRAWALPPLNTTLALRLVELTRIYTALQGVRGRKAVDLEALKAALVAFSELVVELPRIAEIDINPVVVSSDKLLALDARVLLADPKIKDQDLPRSAIRPYPLPYVSRWKMKDGSAVVIRPIRPEDEPLMVRFHESLSEESVYLRYFHMAKLSTRVAHERLIRKCFIDYDREMALIAELTDAHARNTCIAGVARLSRLPSSAEAEIGVVVADRFQHQGLGSELIKRIVDIARIEKIKRVVAEFHSENSAIHHLAKHGGATVERTSDPTCFRIQFGLVA